MNLWGFTPAFHQVLHAAMAAAADASEEAEVLLPEVVAEALDTSSFSVLPAEGRCIGVTHADDLPVVRMELAEMVGRDGRVYAVDSDPAARDVAAAAAATAKPAATTSFGGRD